MKYKPVFARVLIEREVVKETKGGVMIPEHLQKRHAIPQGTIIALGETASETLKVGQKVLFGIHAGAWLDATATLIHDPTKGRGIRTNDDGTLFICQDEDILAVVSDT